MELLNYYTFKRFLCTTLASLSFKAGSASAVIEAGRFNAPNALTLVHSFSETNEWFDDYSQFLALFGAKGELDSLAFARNLDGVNLYFAWVKGEGKYLEK